MVSYTHNRREGVDVNEVEKKPRRYLSETPRRCRFGFPAPMIPKLERRRRGDCACQALSCGAGKTLGNFRLLVVFATALRSIPDFYY